MTVSFQWSFSYDRNVPSWIGKWAEQTKIVISSSQLLKNGSELTLIITKNLVRALKVYKNHQDHNTGDYKATGRLSWQ